MQGSGKASRTQDRNGMDCMGRLQTGVYRVAEQLQHVPRGNGNVSWLFPRKRTVMLRCVRPVDEGSLGERDICGRMLEEELAALRVSDRS